MMRMLGTQILGAACLLAAGEAAAQTSRVQVREFSAAPRSASRTRVAGGVRVQEFRAEIVRPRPDGPLAAKPSDEPAVEVPVFQLPGPGAPELIESSEDESAETEGSDVSRGTSSPAARDTTRLPSFSGGLGPAQPAPLAESASPLAVPTVTTARQLPGLRQQAAAPDPRPQTPAISPSLPAFGTPESSASVRPPAAPTTPPAGGTDASSSGPLLAAPAHQPARPSVLSSLSDSEATSDSARDESPVFMPFGEPPAVEAAAEPQPVVTPGDVVDEAPVLEEPAPATLPELLPEPPERTNEPATEPSLPPSRQPSLPPAAELRIDIRLPSGTPLDVASEHFSTEAAAAADQRAETWGQFQWTAPGTLHHPLYFEDVNLERHGHSYGLLQPAVSAAHFFSRVPALPYLLTAHPPLECVYTLGHERPGSCAPYRLRWPRLRPAAGVVQGGVVTGLVFLIP